MSHECCSFCEGLPGTPSRGWGGQVSKCPVCKQELWVTEDGAYRIDPTIPVPKRFKTPWITAAGLLLAITVGVVIAGINHFTGTPASTTPIPVIAPPEPLASGDNVSPTFVVESTVPTTHAKPQGGYVQARVKPPIEPAKAVVKAAIVEPDATVKSLGTPHVTHYLASKERNDDLVKELAKVPEVDLEPKYMKKTAKDIATMVADAARLNTKDERDGFVKKLKKDRADLADLPFLMGKDCTTEAKESKALAQASLGIRSAMAGATRKVNQPNLYSEGFDSVAHRFWHQLNYEGGRDIVGPAALPALRQILFAENKFYRQPLVEHVAMIKAATATETLANRAVFDLDPDIRRIAIDSLRTRPVKEYRAVLAEGLRYPWPAAVANAAEAVSELRVPELIPDLLTRLDQPDAGAPLVVKGDDGKEKVVVREMVRINHHRNCMLCHAALADPGADLNAFRRGEIATGPVPSPQDRLPPRTSAEYYGSFRTTGPLVRADVTYLRQDFSLVQPVEDHGKWDEAQRFDFLVRTREVTKEEGVGKVMPKDVDIVRGAVLMALRNVTGMNAGTKAQEWRAAIAAQTTK